jgi:hypothetical protein
VKVCGDETLRIRDRSNIEINVTIGVDKDIATPLSTLRRNFYVNNPMCDFKVFLTPNLTISREALEGNSMRFGPKGERFDNFMKIDREKNMFFLNVSDYNMTDVLLKEN